MTIKLESIKADLDLETKGEWIAYPDWPDVEFNVSSIHLPAYETAFSLLTRRLAKQYAGKPVPPDVRERETGKLMHAHLLHGWRGFDVEYTREVALDVMTDVAYRSMRDAVEWCAGRVGARDVEFTGEEEKNSARPSAGN